MKLDNFINVHINHFTVFSSNFREYPSLKFQMILNICSDYFSNSIRVSL